VRTVTIDVSGFEKPDGSSAIRSAARGLVAALAEVDHKDVRVRFVRFDGRAGSFTVLNPQLGGEFAVARTGGLPFDEFGPKDVFFDAAGAGNWSKDRVGLYPALKGVGVRIMSLVDDLTPLELPHLFEPDSVQRLKWFVDAVAEFADLALVFTQAGSRGLAEYYAGVGIEPTPTIVVLGTGVTPLPPSRQQLSAILPDGVATSGYILFVGALERRAIASVALEAIERVIRLRPSTHLVFAGREVSDVSATQMRSHPMYGTRVHWVTEPEDHLLAELYDRAALVVYLSQGEGDGMQVAQPLSRGVVTIASILPALYEVATGCADYLHYDTPGELAETVLAYLGSPDLRDARIEQLRRGFRSLDWATIADTVTTIVANLDRADAIMAGPQPRHAQWVFISNQPDSMQRTVELIDQHVSWVSEYVVVAPMALKSRYEAIPTLHRIVFVPEEELLGGDVEAFARADHVKKNWILRARAAALAVLDDEFIMLDDDNQPVRTVSRGVFFGETHRYNGYFFFELPFWSHRTTDYDRGIENSRVLLASAGLELMAYSSHQPQVVNKELFAAAVTLAGEDFTTDSVEEWSIYFNYVASRYPTLLAKRIFVTLGWPVGPWAWQREFVPTEYVFENYYPRSYEPDDEAGFSAGMSLSEKVRVVADAQAPYDRSRDVFAASRPILQRLDLVHGAMVFRRGDAALVVHGVPSVITVRRGAPLRLPLTFVRFGVPDPTGGAGTEAQFCYRIARRRVSYGVAVEARTVGSPWIANGRFELDFPPTDLEPGVYELEFFAKLEGQSVFVDNVIFRSRLVVCGPEDTVPEVYASL
jgi:glycosyltransferase involved in cell wall biosynthesis